MITEMTAEARAEHLRSLPSWSYDAARNALHRRLEMADFRDALSLMVEIGMLADAADHHPEWANVYNTIDIWLTTHDANGISVRDISLAHKIDQLVLRRT